MIVGIFALLISIGTFWFSIKTIRLYYKVKNWDRIEAKVISKEVFVHEKTSISRSPYGIKAQYEFTIGNTNYTGTRIYLVELMGGQTNHMKEQAETKLNEIKDKITVYVNRDNPYESVMFCEGIGLYYVAFSLGVLALLIGLVNIFK